MAEWVFIGALIALGYTFAGYPCLLYLLARYYRRDVNRAPSEPSVSVIIPVHNEETQIGEKIENCLAFEYPADKLKIIAVSDGSTDGTADVVGAFDGTRVEFLPLRGRRGKVAAQNEAVRQATSEILIFTDVAIRMAPDCVRLIVENFSDPEVGAVSCRDHIVEDERSPGGEQRYIEYDMFVRKYTSQVGSLIGVTGGFYAVRRELAAGGWEPAFPPDFFSALHAIRNGFRVVEDDRVRAHYKTAAKGWDELPRKVRTINRGMHALFSSARLMLPGRYGFVALQLISHKLLRWLMPIFLIALFFSSFALADRSGGFAALFAGQLVAIAFVAFSILGSEERRSRSPFRQAAYFGIANLAILRAWVEFLFGKTYVAWQPTKR